MPLRKDLEKVMLIGSGPIEIGQAAEFDYSGSQACKSLREEGIEVVLVNSNPATIMTDPEMADAVYVEPLTPEYIEKIIAKERPDGIAAGLGGQTALNLTSELAENGILEKYGVEVLGCSLETIETTEDREYFKEAMKELGEDVAKSTPVTSLDEAHEFAEAFGYPVVIRPAYTLGGTGGGIAHDEEELERIVNKGMTRSRIGQVLIEEYLGGWKEFEYEMMRDGNDTAIAVVNMENVDPMGIHTGDSVVVAPSQTLTDEEHHMLRTAALKIIRALGIEGGCNIQFCVNPENGEYRVIEVNPRVSRSSALASKATGYPIARVAAKIAVGKHLHEIENDITRQTVAAFEPMVDYTVVKIPRWPFEKFEGVEDSLTTQMKGTGEVMAIGRTLEEAFQKAVRSLDMNGDKESRVEGAEHVDEPHSMRLFSLFHALENGGTVQELAKETGIDPFFLQKLSNIVEQETVETPEDMRAAKQNGFLDADIGRHAGTPRATVYHMRKEHGIDPAYRFVDTCAGEFSAETPFYYSSFETGNEADAPDSGNSESSLDVSSSQDDDQETSADVSTANASSSSSGETVVILGGGPIRIGQGIEFDYSCVHAVEGVNDTGANAVMINNNPETVSTDYDVSDMLFFEPLTAEDVANVIETVNADRVMVQFGGQTSIDAALPLQNILEERDLDISFAGTPPERIDDIEDRERFDAKLKELGIPLPESGTATSFKEAKNVADDISYPLLVRPSYVIGGRAMKIVHSEEELEHYMKEAVKVSPDRPILLDRFLEDAVELDIDAVADGEDVLIGGVMEHIEPAGVHSGDSACVLPAQNISREELSAAREHVEDIAREFGIVGFLNVQCAVKDGKVYVLEANPRASRTIPFVSKHSGVPLARVAAQVMLGSTLEELDAAVPEVDRVSVKEVVFPFDKFDDVDMNLGPEMKSTGEAMGIGATFGEAFYKAQEAAKNPLPLEGRVLVVPGEKEMKERVEALERLGFEVDVGSEEDLEDYDFLVDLSGTNALKRAAIDHEVTYVSTVQALDAAIEAIETVQNGALNVSPLKGRTH